MSVPADRRSSRASALDHALAPVLPVLIVVLGLACLAGFLRAVAIAPLHVSLDPNEGWNAYHATVAIAGRSPYPDAASFMTNNYPPLSFYFVGLLGAVIGDNVVAGRTISLIAFLCICGFAAIAARRLGGSWLSATFAALLLAGILLLTSDYVGMNDPQLLGHTLQLTGLLFLLREPRTPGAILACAALFVLGGFVKQNLFALPLAALFWLLLFDRSGALRLALWGLVLSLLGLVTFRVLYGFDFLERLNTPRLWLLAQLQQNFLGWFAVGALPACATTALAIWQRNDKAVAFVALYAAIAIASGAMLLGGAGVDVNAMFDADIALSLGAGLALDRLLRRSNPLVHIAGRTLALASVLPLAVIAGSDHDWRSVSFWLHPMHDDAALSARDIAFLHARPGPAICESLAFCYWAGKPADVDVFNLGQQLATRSRPSAPFLRRLAARRFAVIELDETAPFPLPPDAQSAIDRNYRVDHSDDYGVFFVAR